MSSMTSSTSKLTDFSINSIINSTSFKQQQQPTTLSSEHKPTSGKHAINTSVQSHIRKYRPKNFQCSACKMAFSNNGQLKNHVRIHTGERPFRCSHSGCNKTFTRNEELTRHKLIHTGLRPHSCSVCGKRFGRKDHLKKHVKTHERKKLRKKVSNPQPSSFLPQEVFVPKPKSTYNHQTIVDPIVSTSTKLTMPLCNQQKDLSTSTLYTLPRITSTPRLDNIFVTSSSLPNAPSEIFSSFSNLHRASITTSTASVQITPTDTFQQLATDYWNKWYNLLGLYQQQPHYPASLNTLFRRLS